MPCLSTHRISSDSIVLIGQMGEVSIKNVFSKVFSLGLTGCWPVTLTAWFCKLLKFLLCQLRMVPFDTLVSEFQDFNTECSRVKILSTPHGNGSLRLYDPLHTHTQSERALSCISAEQYRRCTFVLPSTLANSGSASRIKSGKDSVWSPSVLVDMVH